MTIALPNVSILSARLPEDSVGVEVKQRFFKIGSLEALIETDAVPIGEAHAGRDARP